MDELALKMQRAEWIAQQIKKKTTHAAVVMAGLAEPLSALADFVVDAERRIQTIERNLRDYAEREVLRP